MKKEWKVYIKSVPNRGNEIIKTLEDLGGNNTLKLQGNRNDAYYFIDSKGRIDVTSIIGGVACTFLKEFYKKIKLPRWKPKYKERYYRINWKGAVVETTWYDTRDEELCFEFGNCFRTKEEAEIARDKFKEMLNK